MMNCVRELPNSMYMDQRVGDSRELMYVKLAVCEEFCKLLPRRFGVGVL